MVNKCKERRGINANMAFIFHIIWAGLGQLPNGNEIYHLITWLSLFGREVLGSYIRNIGCRLNCFEVKYKIGYIELGQSLQPSLTKVTYCFTQVPTTFHTSLYFVHIIVCLVDPPGTYIKCHTLQSWSCIYMKTCLVGYYIGIRSYRILPNWHSGHSKKCSNTGHSLHYL